MEKFWNRSLMNVEHDRELSMAHYEDTKEMALDIRDHTNGNVATANINIEDAIAIRDRIYEFLKYHKA